ncbi:MAG: GTPase [Candidatus Fischerbacteria bacterium RBG_13_37_8]|uniref:GTPase n=1 Tax=Candidatus Fischerbacteria bacterium RBG_13_37_8 TaxID=1817863 RepID=A0A1F5VEZ0_9BACT|nr:MAG: GTPase [Candidatus Fischerbacteria bacterium RBG_13_37_8]
MSRIDEIDIVEVLRQKDRRSVARLISALENREEGAIDIIRKIYAMTGKAWIIGVTGPAGVGKSTLINGMIDEFRKSGKTVGIIAVDPTSPFTGGAILADRIRMQLHSVDEGVFIRSMATRGHLGGLSPATSDVVDLLDAFGKDVIIIETVGVGQDEVDIIKIAHSIAVILMPGMGDEVQTMKAGLMEIADIFVINKAEREGSDRLQAELEMVLGLASDMIEWKPRIIRTVASKKMGIDVLLDALYEHREYIKASEQFKEKRHHAIRQRLFDAYQDLTLARAMSKLQDVEFNEIINDIYERKLDPYTAAEKLFFK